MEYPSLLKNELIGVDDISLESWQYVTHPDVVAFIRQNTRAGERVAMLAKNRDWAYLLEAQRAPQFYFTPSNATFSKRHLDLSLGMIDRLFVIRGHSFNYPEIDEAFWEVISRDFALAGRSQYVDVYERKSVGRM